MAYGECLLRVKVNFAYKDKAALTDRSLASGVNIEKNEPCHTESNWGEQCSFDDPSFCGNGLICKIQDYYCKYEVNPSGVCRKEPKDMVCTSEYAPVCKNSCITGNSYITLLMFHLNR